MHIYRAYFCFVFLSQNVLLLATTSPYLKKKNLGYPIIAVNTGAFCFSKVILIFFRMYAA